MAYVFGNHTNEVLKGKYKWGAVHARSAEDAPSQSPACGTRSKRFMKTVRPSARYAPNGTDKVDCTKCLKARP
jgi:hypothetical protein